MSTQHALGPWEIKVREHGKNSVCTVYGTDVGWIDISAPNSPDVEDYRGQRSANARLIASAPDLLEALRVAIEVMENVDGENDCTRGIKTARAAIAKATGEAA